jgi:TolA-binding protein
MSQGETPEAAAELSFERALLASARTDALPTEATEDAWLRFSAAAGALGTGAGVLAAEGWRFWPPSGWRAGFRWLAAGAAAGSAVTALLLGGRAEHAPERATVKSDPVFVSTPAPPRVPTAAVVPPVPHPAEVSSAPEEPTPSMPSARAAPRTASRSRSAPSPAPALAAEIAALDAVRQAMAARDFERALEATEAYAREFPRGQLAADADALAAQALAAQGERAAARERAQRFLERHPDDPHAARMRRLLDP